MWDTAPSGQHTISHDRPCPACGHAAHTYLPCSDRCACTPPGVPGGIELTRELVGQL